ncbi:MAG TPA: ATP-binding protein [Pyrinomonadaceae bacterium]|nr:ATP-binding protein [Pyrinomonadaceae bacterium]
MSDRPELNLESLREWARAALEPDAETHEPEPSPLAHKESEAWPLLLEAAVVSSFLPRQLAPHVAEGGRRAEAEKAVLAFAETTYLGVAETAYLADAESAGEPKVKWALTQPARAEVLGAALGTPALDEAVRRTAESPDFADKVSSALRDCLKMGRVAAERADLKSLEATRIAAASLSGVSGVELPDLDDLDREIQFRRLLEQFQRMVGQRQQDGGAERTQYFFGRDHELEQLRAYVGVIESDTVLQSAARVFSSVSRAVRGRAPMAVWGVGGVGKTTLVSKFMLEHAEAASSRFPFAYLDFDRITVSARQKSGLLAEMCLQTGAQFKELSRPMAHLRARAQKLAGSSDASEEFESVSQLSPLMREFRRLVDEYLNEHEKMFEWSRPFLLVFDTFEVVQYREDGVAELEDFVKGFTLPGEKHVLWPRLRLIISGRKKVEEFILKVEELPLGALDPDGSAQLLTALARDFGKPMTRADADALVAAVAKATGERGGGVQPLRLRLIGEVFRDPQKTEDGPAIARSLRDELSRPLRSGGSAAQVFIDGVLIRRVLGHVTDPRVAALADPGLVVRHITPDVIMNVMTRGTPRPKIAAPATTPEEAADGDSSGVWEVDKTEAEDIFKAFRREVSLVEADGDALRHRPDVRQQMLGLIQANRPEQFENLHRLAFKHFRRLAASNEEDHASAAEAVYHGLWLGEDLEQLNRLWPKQHGFDARIDPNEFEQGSAANVFVRAKTRAALKSDEISKLPREVALEWLDARSHSLLNERRVEHAIETIRTAAGHDYAALDERPVTASTLARLLYRAGHWDDAATLAMRHLERAGRTASFGSRPKTKSRRAEGDDSRGEALLSLARTWATIVGKCDDSPEPLERIAHTHLPAWEHLARVEMNAYAVVARERGGSNVPPEYFLQNIKESARAVRPSSWRSNQRILRLAILTNPDLVGANILLMIWVECCERVPRAAEWSALETLLSQVFSKTPSGKMAAELLKNFPSRRPDEFAARFDELWQKEKGYVLHARGERPGVSYALRSLVACDHSDWVRPLGNALTRALKGEAGGELSKVLEKENFLHDVTEKRGLFSQKGSQRRQQDGVAVAQFAEDRGDLLRLAGRLSERWDEFSHTSREERPPRYPRDVFGISHALLRWHETLTKRLVPIGSPPGPRSA